MQEQNNGELARHFKALRSELAEIDINYIELVVGLIKERATFISEFWGLSQFFFETPSGYNEKAAKKAWKEDTDNLMNEVVGVINKTDADSSENLQKAIKDWIEFKQIGFGKVMMPLRLALVEDLKGPDVFQIMFMIGRDETIRRIELAVNSF